MPALVLLAYLSLFSFGVVDNLRGPFYPDLLADLGLNGTRGSWFFGVVSLFSFVGASTGHWIVHRRSSLYLINGGSMALGLGFALIGTSQSLFSLLVYCAIFGWGFGALNLSQNLIVGEASPPHLRRRFYSGLHSMYAIAAVVAPLVAAFCRFREWDWRLSFVIMSAIPIVLSLAGCFFQPHTHAPGAKDLSKAPLNRAEYRRCFYFILLMAAYLWGEISISTRMPLWLRESRGFRAENADFYLAGFFVALAVGRTLFGVMDFKKLGNWKVMLFSTSLAALFLGLGLATSPLFAVLGGLAMAPFYPVCMEQVALSFPGKSSRAIGLIVGFGSFSAFVMHVTVGYLNDLVGIERALYVGPVALALAAGGLMMAQMKKGNV